MKTIIVTAQEVNAQNAKELSEKLGIVTVNAKGNERTDSEQSKFLKTKLNAAEKKGEALSYTEGRIPQPGKNKKAGVGEIVKRKGKVTKSQQVRDILAQTGEDFDRLAMVDKLCKKFNWPRDLAGRYLVDNFRRVFPGKECYGQEVA